MKLTIKDKAKLFWDRNKTTIITLLVSAGVITGVGCAVNHYAKKAEEEKKALEAEAARKASEAEEAALKAAEEKEKEIMSNPDNQIAGGYVMPSNDNLCEPEYPNILVNTVPVANMGVLGEEVVERLNKEWFGEFGETGEENLFDPKTATVDVMIDFGHEVWKRNHPEEAESQEKQAP